MPRHQFNLLFVGFILFSIHLVCKGGESVQHDLTHFRSEFHVVGEGFHRVVQSSSSAIPLSLKDCSILIRWTIPTGMYVDPYQLQTSIMNGTIHFSSHVNVEQMAHRAEPLVLYNLPKLDCSATSCHFSLSIPIHLRYQLPSTTDSYTRLSPPTPTSYFSCDCPTSTIDVAVKRCAWTQLPESKVLDHDILVPVGDLSHSIIVTLVTMAVALTGTGYVAWIVVAK